VVKRSSAKSSTAVRTATARTSVLIEPGGSISLPRPSATYAFRGRTATRRDNQLFRWNRRCAGSGGYAIALIATLAAITTASPAAAAYWYGGGHKHHTAHKNHEAKAADRTDKEPVGQIQKGPLQIFISINQQKLHVYSDGVHVADTSIATGVPSLPTPLGVFSVIQKQVFHRSNIYNDAPMPYMQRITWSGVAMHEGENIGHPASHGCIRMPRDFAIRLYRLTKLNTRVVIARSELKPVDFADPHLFVHEETAPEVTVSLPPNGVEPATAKPAELAIRASTPAPAPPVQSDLPSPSAAPAISGEQKTAATRPPDPSGTGDATMQAPPAQPEDATKELAKVAAAKKTPISIFISRKRQRLYIRQDLEPLFDTPIVIAQPEAPFDTYVFTALEFTGGDRTTMRWNVVSLPAEAPKRAHYVEERPRNGKHDRSHRREIEDETTASPPSSSPAQVLARIEIPPEVIEAISQMILPGSSLIVSDQGLGDETGEGTDFIVVTR
jgi:L,D-transpeptidase catalytic domain